MPNTIEETYGKLVLTQLFTHVWFGDWDEYEKAINQLPDELIDAFPFHKHYDREESALWHENYFSIPGPYFIPPYLSSYTEKTEDEQEKAKQDLLYLIGAFDKVGFYYPLEKDEFPDHIGSLTAFITAAAKKEIEATKEGNTELVKQMNELQQEIYESYLRIAINELWSRYKNHIQDSFFKEFVPFYLNAMEDLRDE
ncbi:MAG TPA: molecular chaperone TorD family protein [Virgibacillus sp.]|nr:molecular chaperone TorD family protein [Virgibacillus sp.]HLR69721.1 molecular chaperone TorD family protein [Virgibacillus sp.]